VTASSCRIARICCTFVIIIAINGSVLASTAWIARILCTFVVVITIDGSVYASACPGAIALNAFFSGTIIAIVTFNRCVVAASVRAASINSTDIGIVTDYGRFSATSKRIA